MKSDSKYIKIKTDGFITELPYADMVLPGHERMLEAVTWPIEDIIQELLTRTSPTDIKKTCEKLGKLHPFYQNQWLAMRTIGETMLFAGNLSFPWQIFSEYFPTGKKPERFRMALQGIHVWQNKARICLHILQGKKTIKTIDNAAICRMVITIPQDSFPILWYECLSITDIFSFELFDIITKKIPPRICECCGRLFTPYQDNNLQFCSFPKENGKSCLQEALIGKSQVFYRKAYQTHEQRTRRGSYKGRPYGKQEFRIWKETAQSKRLAFLSGEISWADYEKSLQV